MRIFLMNDDYGTVVVAKDEEQAQKYFRSTFDCEVDDDYCSVKREISPGEIGIFEDVGTMTFGEFLRGYLKKKYPLFYAGQCNDTFQGNHDRGGRSK